MVDSSLDLKIYADIFKILNKKEIELMKSVIKSDCVFALMGIKLDKLAVRQACFISNYSHRTRRTISKDLNTEFILYLAKTRQIKNAYKKLEIEREEYLALCCGEESRFNEILKILKNRGLITDINDSTYNRVDLSERALLFAMKK
jgi:tRNA threonylcarbamoyladenosine modification (KEOPS) complex Cgi121 subunit